jgi:hypothetical protein
MDTHGAPSDPPAGATAASFPDGAVEPTGPGKLRTHARSILWVCTNNMGPLALAGDNVADTGEELLRSAPAAGSRRKAGRQKTSDRCAKCSKHWKGACCTACPGWAAAAAAATPGQAVAAAFAAPAAAAAATIAATAWATAGGTSDLASSAPEFTPR